MRGKNSKNKRKKEDSPPANPPSAKKANQFSALLSSDEEDEMDSNSEDYSALQQKHEELKSDFNTVLQELNILKQAHNDLMQAFKNQENTEKASTTVNAGIIPNTAEFPQPHQNLQTPSRRSQNSNTVNVRESTITHTPNQVDHQPNVSNFSLPPIITNHVNISHLLRSMRDKNINIKITNNRDKATIKTSTKSDYDAVAKYLSEQKYEFFSFTPKEERSVLLILKGLNNTMVLDDVTNDLKDLLPSLPNGALSKHIINKKSTDNFILKLPNNFDVSKILEINYICSQKIHWERFKINGVAQCKRCQGFKHVAKNCNKAYNCVKCLDVHEPGECNRKDRNEGLPKCINCKGDHPANYKNCPIFKDVLQSRQKLQQQNRDVNNRNLVNSNHNVRVPGKSFLQAFSENQTRNHEQLNSYPKNTPLNKDLYRFIDVLPNELFGCNLPFLLNKISEFNSHFNSITDVTEQKLEYLKFVSSLCFKN